MKSRWTVPDFRLRVCFRMGLAAQLAALIALALCSLHAAAENPPEVIRIGAPSYAGQNGKQVSGGIMGIVRYKDWFEQEFAREKTRFEYPGFKGGAPFVGQALANGQIDFAWQGDLLSIIGRSSGMKTRLILPLNKLVNAYLVVPANSTISAVKELRGKRVGYNKGNQIHLQALRILAANGLSEKDISSLKLDPGNAATVLTTGDVDAIFIGSEALALRDKGVARVIYSTRDDVGPDTLAFTSYNGLLVNEDFAKKYPETTARLVKTLVKAAWWASEDRNRQELLQIWGEGPLPPKYIVEDYASRPWTDRLSPLFDPLLVAHYTRTEEQIGELGLLRGPKYDIASWIDRRYLDQSLHELKLESYWTPLDAQGRPAAR